jgi:hypothetical protein
MFLRFALFFGERTVASLARALIHVARRVDAARWVPQYHVVARLALAQGAAAPNALLPHIVRPGAARALLHFALLNLLLGMGKGAERSVRGNAEVAERRNNQRRTEHRFAAFPVYFGSRVFDDA